MIWPLFSIKAEVVEVFSLALSIGPDRQRLALKRNNKEKQKRFMPFAYKFG
jgi:hypothetical protein